MKSPDKLKQRRTRFVKEYLIDQNASRAAVAAGYSEKGAHVAGQRLLRNVAVQAQIEHENDKINQKLDVSVERVKSELARLAFYDPRDFFAADGSAIPVTSLTEDAARALAGFEMAELFTGSGEQRATAGYIKKFKLIDKTKALEQLGRHLKMFTDKVEVNTSDEIIRRLVAGRKRVSQS